MQTYSLTLHDAQSGHAALQAFWQSIKPHLIAGTKVQLEAFDGKTREQERLCHSCYRDLARDALLGGIKADEALWKEACKYAFYVATKDDPDFGRFVSCAVFQDSEWRHAADPHGYDGKPHSPTHWSPLPAPPGSDALSPIALAQQRIDALRTALECLIEKCDDSDDVCYGTLGTGFVRNIARAALAKATPEKQA